ncbi:MAG TPA: tetratricopeptide repeat protein [Verrucomicrobiae bacterium]|jgi:tetratricopeptide (TPR) repeat protein|nr:tetratricopeptide repeat protein [Verrucomicrobiae bacterium]
MTMNRAYLNPSLALLLLMMVPMNVTISGRVLDREGKPMANARVVYTDSETGKVYQMKTNKKGEFSSLVTVFGFYKIEITAPDGTRVYTGTRSVGITRDVDPKPLQTNVLNVDLSTVGPNGEMATSTSAGNKSESEIAAIRKENARAIRINQLMPELHTALDARDWPRATSILQQLIAIDPSRWEYYQNLGTVQSNQAQYQDAVRTYGKAIELAEKTNGDHPSAEARATMGQMLISQADGYDRLGKLDEALASYAKAAALAPQPALAHFFACNALRNGGKLEAAIAECDQAIASDPVEWEFYQTKAGAQNTLDKNDAALETYEKGIQVAQAAMDANVQPVKAKTGLGQMLNAQGNIYVQLKQYDKAMSAFTRSAEVSASSALPYFNLCAMQYNVNNAEAALAACDKAIASDPGMADAYFVKASVLFGKGNLQKDRYQTPEGTSEALAKYLELSPEGQHAADARAMLERIGAKMDSTYIPRSK